MLKKPNGRDIPAKVKKLLELRSANFCEVCWMDIVCDKHHIFEFSNWGEHSVDNLICLCPSCHREIPKHLNVDQQREFQIRHQNRINPNRQQSHSISAPTDTLYFWICEFIECDEIFNIYSEAKKKKIIWISKMPYAEGLRFYLNVLFIGYDGLPNLLILNNRVICNDNSKWKIAITGHWISITDWVLVRPQHISLKKEKDGIRLDMDIWINLLHLTPQQIGRVRLWNPRGKSVLRDVSLSFGI